MSKVDTKKSTVKKGRPQKVETPKVKGKVGGPRKGVDTKEIAKPKWKRIDKRPRKGSAPINPTILDQNAMTTQEVRDSVKNALDRSIKKYPDSPITNRVRLMGAIVSKLDELEDRIKALESSSKNNSTYRFVNL